jgi:hypothetical protein
VDHRNGHIGDDLFSEEADRRTSISMEDSTSRNFPIFGGVLLGLGLGGFFDGIVFHQLLQWHHMLSGWYPLNSIDNVKLNTIGGRRLSQRRLCSSAPWPVSDVAASAHGRLSPVASSVSARSCSAGAFSI